MTTLRPFDLATRRAGLCARLDYLTAADLDIVDKLVSRLEVSRQPAKSAKPMLRVSLAADKRHHFKR